MNFPTIHLTLDHINQLVDLNKKIENNASREDIIELFLSLDWEAQEEVCVTTCTIGNRTLSPKNLAEARYIQVKLEELTFYNFKDFHSGVQKVIEMTKRSFNNNENTSSNYESIESEENDSIELSSEELSQLLGDGTPSIYYRQEAFAEIAGEVLVRPRNPVEEGIRRNFLYLLTTIDQATNAPAA